MQHACRLLTARRYIKQTHLHRTVHSYSQARRWMVEQGLLPAGSMARPPKPQAMARRADSLPSEEATPSSATATPARGPRDASASPWGGGSAVTIGSRVGGGLISRYESHPVPPSAQGAPTGTRTGCADLQCTK